jgi:hypothetical protein
MNLSMYLKDDSLQGWNDVLPVPNETNTHVHGLPMRESAVYLACLLKPVTDWVFLQS